MRFHQVTLLIVLCGVVFWIAFSAFTGWDLATMIGSAIGSLTGTALAVAYARWFNRSH
jgi:uncharacterized transporter YbjL